MTSKSLQEAIELIEFASTPPSILPTKETKDPFDLVTRTLCDKVLSSSFNTSFQNLQLEPLPCTSSTETNTDSRLLYSDILRFILSIFCEQAAAASLPIDDWTILSSKQIETIIRTFEMLVAMSILPSIDQGIGVPLEKRVTFVKVWKPFEDASQRIEHLQKTLHIFQRLSEVNDGLKIQLISKFLPDFISANEQLIHLNDFSLKGDYESFLKKLPLSVVMKELLLLYGGFGLSGRKAMAPAWFVSSLSKKLSEGLTSQKGLSNLLLAFDELGGESFWNNTVALSSVATLLATKPQQAESFQKYALSMFSQFLDIMKNSKFGSNVSLLFVLTVDKLYGKAPRLVEVQLVDKIIRPWELLVERGIQSLSTKENGYWNANLDGSLVILRSWLNTQPQQYSIKYFPFANRFLKLIPLFLHLCGQATTLEELKVFSDDLSLILMRLLNDDLEESEVLLKYMLNDGNKTHGYFKVSAEKNSPVSEGKEGITALKYPVSLEIFDDPMDEETLLDFKIDSFRAIAKILSTEAAVKCIVVLVSDCLNAWISTENVIPMDEDSLRFVPELEKHVAEHSKKLKAVYILCSVVEILTSIETDSFSADVLTDMVKIAKKIFVAANKRLSSVIDVDILEKQNKELKTIEAQTTNLAVGLVSAISANALNDDSLKLCLQEVGKEMNNFCQTIEKLSDSNSMIELYKSAYESSKQLLDLFSNDLKWDISTATTQENKFNPAKFNKHTINKIEEWKISFEDDEEAVKGGILIEISQALRRKDKSIFSNIADFEWVWKAALDNAGNTDSYVFLASINVLAELSYWQSDAFLPRLLECFTNWDDSNLSKDVSLMWKCTMGEALAKVFKQIGNFSIFYFDQFSNSLLHLTKSGDELIRSSALSSFADLIVACRGRKYDAMIQELLLLVSQYLKNEESILVRRAAVHLLRCLLTSADDNLLTTFSDTIRDVHRMLKRLWLQDQDDVVRFHAELALIDLKSIMQRLFENIMVNNSENKENCESANNLHPHHAVEHEIKHRNVHVADWSHEIGDQHIIDSHNVPYKSAISSVPHHGNKTFTRKSTNYQPKRNRSQNQNRQPDLPKPQKYGPPGPSQPSSTFSKNSRSYNPAFNRQSSEHSQIRNRQPPVLQPSVQTSRSATSGQTFTLMSRNPDSHIQVTIPTVSNDVRFDTRFNKNCPPFIPRQIIAPQVDNVKPTFQQNNDKNGKPKNDPPNGSCKGKPATPSTSQVSTKQTQKPYHPHHHHQNGPKGKVPPKPSQADTKKSFKVDAKEKVMTTPSTSEVKQIQKISIPPKPVVKKCNPFGDAKPVDVSKKLIEVEQKKLEEQKKLDELKKLKDQKKAEEQKKLKVKKKAEEEKKTEEEEEDDDMDESKDDIPAEDLMEVINSLSFKSRRNSL